MTPWVIRLLFLNVAAFFLQRLAGEGFERLFVFYAAPISLVFRPWTLVTYQFLHGGLGHLFFNMLSLFFFGPRLEAKLGSRKFITLYLLSGITGALISIPFSPGIFIIGASGAVFGVLLGFARYWPRDQILIWGVLPVEARWMVVGMTALSLWSGFGGSGGGIAHFAHLGGFLGGFLYLRWIETHTPQMEWQKKLKPKTSPLETATAALARWSRIRRDELHEVNRAELDRILDKISRSGMSSLTPADREFLDRFSAQRSP